MFCSPLIGSSLVHLYLYFGPCWLLRIATLDREKNIIIVTPLPHSLNPRPRCTVPPHKTKAEADPVDVKNMSA